MELVYGYPAALTARSTHYCPGCTHGIVHRLIAEVIDELGIQGQTIGVAPVGCAVLAYDYFDMDFVEASHGRAPAMATGIKRVSPDKIVFTYQGDGDLAAIGTAEIIQAANRGELITTIFINNAIYGMTGGQMAPTTLPGMVTTSSPAGRDCRLAGYPVQMSEILAVTAGAAYITRETVADIPSINKTRNAIKRAFMTQMAGLGFACVEVLSTCPTNWNMDPWKAMEWAKENMTKTFPLGTFKMTDAVKALKA
ncbi:MAG TPA: thiamine pyrophosphate-dependent enzyme [Anaerolineae bacterium]|nr:thiamine pyrophosphate-dependent enzyme [Anaerolineae bacterium]HQK12404.1 thiamine pyrophosphate-dependent enzyme [Anaerolineae bacterium]